jgi:ribosomal protein S12 methylthiotransferase
VGCFEYSPVEGAAANALSHAVPAEVKAERYARFMELSKDISTQKLAQKVGRKMRVLVDRIDTDVAIARSTSDAPEIDGTVKILDAGGLKVGEFAQVRITGADAYDLEARQEP